MTDLALAMRNPRILEAFFKGRARRTGAAPGLVTYNFRRAGRRAEKLGHGSRSSHHPLERRRRPNASRPPPPAAQAAKACDFPIWAERLGQPEGPTEEERAALRKAALAGAVARRSLPCG